MKELKDGREWFDGEAVDIYEGRFTGPFILDEANGASMSNGDLVTFIVTARVDAPRFTYMRKTGDLKRSNAMKVAAVVPISADKARFLYDSLSTSVDGVNNGLIETEPSVIESADVKPDIIQDNFFNDGIEDQLSLDEVNPEDYMSPKQQYGVQL